MLISSSDSSHTAKTQAHILVVDDEPSITSALERELEDFDYKVTSASSGEEALAKLSTIPIDLIISDMRMPNMDGGELLAHVAQKWPQTGRILLTGFSDVQSAITAINQGKIFYYLSKPWNTSELINIIESFFQQKNQRDKKEAEQLILELNNQRLEEENVALEQLSMQDVLTGIANRRAFNQYLEKEINRSKRRKTSISLIMADVDYFKKYNDTLGHQAGDECLKRIGQKLKDSFVRGGDFPARYGGEEFAIVLADTCHMNDAIKAAEYLKTCINNLQISHPESPVSQFVSMSIGVATSELEYSFTVENLIGNADNALYKAKNAGRNKIIHYSNMD